MTAPSILHPVSRAHTIDATALRALLHPRYGGRAVEPEPSGLSTPPPVTKFEIRPPSTPPPAARTEVPRSKRRWGLVAIGSIGLLVAVGAAGMLWKVASSRLATGLPLAANYRGSFAVQPGDVVPAFEARLLAPHPAWGTTVSRQDLVGRPTVLFVWASWAEGWLPMADGLINARLLQPISKEALFLGLALDDDPAAARRAMPPAFAEWPHLADRAPSATGRRVSETLNAKWAPAIYVLDRHGRLVHAGIRAEDIGKALAGL